MYQYFSTIYMLILKTVQKKRNEKVVDSLPPPLHFTERKLHWRETALDGGSYIIFGIE